MKTAIKAAILAVFTATLCSCASNKVNVRKAAGYGYTKAVYDIGAVAMKNGAVDIDTNGEGGKPVRVHLLLDKVEDRKVEPVTNTKPLPKKSRPARKSRR